MLLKKKLKKSLTQKRIMVGSKEPTSSNFKKLSRDDF